MHFDVNKISDFPFDSGPFRKTEKRNQILSKWFIFNDAKPDAEAPQLHPIYRQVILSDRLPITMCQQSKLMEINQLLSAPTFSFSLSFFAEPFTLKCWRQTKYSWNSKSIAFLDEILENLMIHGGFDRTFKIPSSYKNCWRFEVSKQQWSQNEIRYFIDSKQMGRMLTKRHCTTNHPLDSSRKNNTHYFIL